MPIGSYSAFRDIIRMVLMQNPSSVLDLGVGHGINGAGVRNWLDLGYKYKTRLVGVEGFADYYSPLWDCYDKVHVMDIRNFLADNKEKFDCIIMTDVLEHFDKLEGETILQMAEASLNPGGGLLISTPAVWIEQGDAYGNEFERHKSLWHWTDFIGHEIVKDGREDDMGYMMLVVKITKPA